MHREKLIGKACEKKRLTSLRRIASQELGIKGKTRIGLKKERKI